jgi:methyltransferase
MPGLDSRLLYTLLVLLVAGERLAELAVSRRNERRLRARGAVEAGAGHFPAMAALHAAWLAACPLEVWLLDRPFLPPLAAAAALALVLTMALRYWVIATLGDRWCTRVLVPPGEPPIAAGPYRWLRHPNYLAVAVEVFALPLIHTAWLTAAVLGGANLAILAIRIRAEDRALAGAGTTSAPRP